MRHLIGRATLAALLSAMSAGIGAQERDPVTQERVTPPGGDVPLGLEKDATAERRDVERRTEMEIGQLGTLLRDLETRALSADRADKEEADGALRAAREKMDRARSALSSLRTAENETWAALRVRADIALEDLRDAYERARDAVR